MTWQQWVEQRAAALGLQETSGYRTPQQEAALGGPATSYHTRGTPQAPGAIDIGGSAAALRQLFAEIRAQFAGRINELYLNLPGGGSQDLKNNAPLGYNPEAGRAQHLHVALSGSLGPAAALPAGSIDPATGHVIDPSTGVPMTAGAPHYAANGAGEDVAAGGCPSAFQWAEPAAWPSLLTGRQPPEGSLHTICWSDVWIYGAAVGVLLSGAVLTFAGAKR